MARLENYTFLTFVHQASEPNVYAASKVVTSKGFSNVLNIPKNSVLSSRRDRKSLEGGGKRIEEGLLVIWTFDAAPPLAFKKQR